MRYAITWADRTTWVDAASFDITEGHLIFYSDFCPIAAFPPGWEGVGIDEQKPETKED